MACAPRRHHCRTGYKKLATLRGLIRVLAVAQVAYFVLHTAWVLAADFYGGARL
jgi:hypothetical protein